jgi:hypothetical protein
MPKPTEPPRVQEIATTCRSIRAHWTGAKRRDRRQQAICKQRQLLQRLVRCVAAAL